MKRISGGQLSREAKPRFYQLTPAILGPRRATQALPVRPGRVDAIVTSQPAASPRTPPVRSDVTARASTLTVTIVCALQHSRVLSLNSSARAGRHPRSDHLAGVHRCECERRAIPAGGSRRADPCRPDRRAESLAIGALTSLAWRNSGDLVGFGDMLFDGVISLGEALRAGAKPLGSLTRRTPALRNQRARSDPRASREARRSRPGGSGSSTLPADAVARGNQAVWIAEYLVEP